MSKHTKGDWIKRPSLNGPVFIFGPNIHVDPKDADIVAAAPEMLELLKELEAYLCFRSEVDPEQVAVIKESVRSVISKAEGAGNEKG